MVALVVLHQVGNGSIGVLHLVGIVVLHNQVAIGSKLWWVYINR